MRLLCIGLGIVLAGCGARTGLRGVGADAGAPGSVTPTCTKPQSPWLLFDYSAGNGQPYGIAAMRLDGSSFHVVDPGSANVHRNPSVSPDGRSLLYISSSDTQDSLMLRDLASGKTRTIAQTTYTLQNPGLGKAAVSPDNKWIAFSDDADVEIATFTGSDAHVLVKGPYQAGCCPWGYGHPEFSADSSLIYFSTISRLESIRPDGSGRKLLYQDQFFSNPLISGFDFPNASLSPDGQKMVAEVACDVGELRVFDVGSLPADPCKTGTKLVEIGLSEATNEAANPSWGPDGQIAYDDAKDLFVIPATGGKPRNVTAGFTTKQGAMAADPVWAPGCADIP